VTALKELLDELYLNWKRIDTELSWIRTYLTNPEFIELSRKEKALKITEMFKEKSGIVFALLDNRGITPQKLWKTFNGK
jgi:hypothetical protein